MKFKQKIILAVASSGGHLVQLRKVLDPLKKEVQTIYVSTDPEDSYSIPDFSRKTLGRIPISIRSLCKLFKEHRPTHVITTGAAPGLLAIIMGRLTGRRSLWIDSCANVEELSGSGKIARFIANRTISQWENVAKKYRHVEFVGNSLTKPSRQ